MISSQPTWKQLARSWKAVARSAILRLVASARGSPRRLVILYAHDVGPQAHRLCVPVNGFAAQVDTLAEEGWQVTALSEALRARRIRRGGRQLALCFDDGYEGVYEYAYPILERYRFRATVFACTGYLEACPSWEGMEDYLEAARCCGRSIRLMSLVQLADLRRCGWEIGAHSVTHPDLRRLPRSAARYEVEASRQTLEQALGERVTSFCYPYGAADGAVAKLVAAAGLSIACGTRRGHATGTSDRLHLPRLHLSPEIDPSTVRAMLSPVFPGYLAAAAVARRLLNQGDEEDGRGRP